MDLGRDQEREYWYLITASQTNPSQTELLPSCYVRHGWPAWRRTSPTAEGFMGETGNLLFLLSRALS